MAELKTARMIEDVDTIGVLVTFKESTDLSSVPAAFAMRKSGYTTRVLDWVAAEKEDRTEDTATPQTTWRLFYNFGPGEVGDYEGKYKARFRLDFGNGETPYYPEDTMLNISFRRGV